MRELLARTGSRAGIGVDGGIDLDTISRVASAGATMVVVGSALFRQPDLGLAIKDLREASGVQAACNAGAVVFLDRACPLCRTTRWGSRHSRTTSSGSKWRAPTCCGHWGGATGRWSTRACRCRHRSAL